MTNQTKFEHFEESVVSKEPDIFNSPVFEEYRQRWHEYPEKRILSDFPMNLDLYITNRCNLQCVMCRRTLEVQKGLNSEIYQEEQCDMDLNVYKKVIDEAAREGVYAIHLTAYGEPLLHEDIIEMIKYAREKNILDLFMHTNGTILFENVASELLEAGLTRLIFSVDSPVKEIYEKIRIGADFDVVVDNIKKFMELKRKRGFKYPFVRVQMVEMENNRSQRDSYYNYFKNIVDSVGRIEYINFNEMDDGNRYYRKRRYKENYVCRQLWQRLCVNFDGNVYACLVINENTKLGDVDNSTIKELWHGEKMKELRNDHIEGNIGKITPCSNCGMQLESILDKEK
jgi:radical SAM protein with 4Fe4S-binding SPASM domain